MTFLMEFFGLLMILIIFHNYFGLKIMICDLCTRKIWGQDPDLDPDSPNLLDPDLDSTNPDPLHCNLHKITSLCKLTYYVIIMLLFDLFRST